MVIGLLPTLVGLDPGAANTLLYIKGRGVAVNEPSLVTIRTSTGAIEAVGGEAEAGRGRTPRKFQTARPIRAGMVTDHRLFIGMLQRFLRKAHISGSLHRLKIVIAIPGGMTEVERLKTSSTSRLWVNVSTIVYEEPRRNRMLIVHLARDISHRKKKEELLAKMLDLSRALAASSEHANGLAPVSSLSEQEQANSRAIRQGQKFDRDCP